MKNELESIDHKLLDVFYYTDLEDEYGVGEIYIGGRNGEKIAIDREMWNHIFGVVRGVAVYEKIISFFNIINEVVCYRCSELVVSELLNKRVKSESSDLNWAYSNLSQAQREGLLQGMGVLSKDLTESMAEIRHFRNSFIHYIHNSYVFTKVDEAIPFKIDLCVETVNELNDMTNNPSILSKMA